MYTVLYIVVLGWALASTEHIIIAARSNISINSFTAKKSSDTVLFTNVNEVSFKVRANSFQVSVLRKQKNKRKVNLPSVHGRLQIRECPLTGMSKY